jgi:hypothetical protein
MRSFTRTPILAAILASLALASLAAAQVPTSGRLGLSAAPDRYEATIDVTVGDPFTLYVILTGVDQDTPLPFALDTVSWVINTECCGDSPVGVTGLVHAEGFTVTGDPYEELTTTAPGCPAADTLLLATATFEWLMEGAEDFALSATPLTGALDCEGEPHLLGSLFVVVDGSATSPVASESWSRIRSLFRD